MQLRDLLKVSIATMLLLLSPWIHGSAATPVNTPSTELEQYRFEERFGDRMPKRWQFVPAQGGYELSLVAESPQKWDFRKIERLEVKAHLSERFRHAVRLRWILESRLGGLYAAATPVPISAADYTLIALQPSINAGQLAPLGHGRPWDELAAAEVISVCLRAEVTGDADKPLTIALKGAALRYLEQKNEVKPIVAELVLWQSGPEIDAAATLTFRIVPLMEDPFQIDGPGDVRVTHAGKVALAYLDQQLIAQSDGSAQSTLAVGLPRFVAHLSRFNPEEDVVIEGAGRQWSFRIPKLERRPDQFVSSSNRVIDTRWSVTLERNTLLPEPPHEIDLWAGAPNAWRYDLIQRNWVLLKLQPVMRVWRPVTFWREGWGNFGGIARPDFSLAQQLDDRLKKAVAEGSTLPLICLDGESLASQGIFTWHSHPLHLGENRLIPPGRIVASEEGLNYYLRVARYTLARWSKSKAVDAFVLNPRVNVSGIEDFLSKFILKASQWEEASAKPILSLHPLTVEPAKAAGVGILTFKAYPEKTTPTGLENNIEIKPLPDHGPPLLDDKSEAVEVFTTIPTAHVGIYKSSLRARVVYNKRAADDFHPAEALHFDVWIPEDLPQDLRAGIHLRDRDEIWYQTLLPGLLRPGDWTRCMLDLTGENKHGLTPLGDNTLKPWTDYSRGRIKEIGLHIYSVHQDTLLRAKFANIRGVRYLSADRPKPVIQVLRSTSDSMVGGLWTCDLQPNRHYANPFDPRDVELYAQIRLPSGSTVKVDAFFNQACERTMDQTGREVLKPMGREFWTIRYRLLESGPHEIQIVWREGGRYEVVNQSWVRDERFMASGEPLQPILRGRGDWVFSYPPSYGGRRVIEQVEFQSGKVVAEKSLRIEVHSARQPWKGFIRKDEGGRYFRYDDGSFYYALGPCLRSPSDNRLPYDSSKWTRAFLTGIEMRGTYQFDEYFSEFSKAGMNWGRVWLCSWWGALQWRRDWPEYQGLGRYNLFNAWRMDHVLDSAEKHGVALNLCLINHGQFSRAIDAEWENNPYNVDLGGPLKVASEFFTTAQGKIYHRNMLRYIVARWGHSPAILSWALFSELEFTEEYRASLRYNGPDAPAPHIEAWHREMSEYLKRIDPNRHLVSTHYSHPVRGTGTLVLPEIDIAMSNAYSAFQELAGGRKDAPAALYDFWHGNDDSNLGFKGFRIFNKPVLVEEQGRHWMGVEGDGINRRANNTFDNLNADLHCGLWGSLVQPFAGATGYWWWLHVHFDNRYFEYKALAEFLKGEDFRPTSGETILEPHLETVEISGDVFIARSLKSRSRAYVWIYHRQAPFRTTGFSPIRGAHLHVKDMESGKYEVEFWDTVSGVCIEKRKATIVDNRDSRQSLAVAIIPLPPIARDIALKFKPIK